MRTPARDSVAGTPSQLPESIAPALPPGAAATAELRVALEQLLRGARTQQQPGTDSWFSAATAAALRDVVVDSVGHAIVDFHDLRTLIPNASSSAGSALLITELNGAVFSVAQVQSVEYRMLGSCAAFWEWLQYSCRRVTRDEHDLAARNSVQSV